MMGLILCLMITKAVSIDWCYILVIISIGNYFKSTRIISKGIDIIQKVLVIILRILVIILKVFMIIFKIVKLLK